MNYEVKNKQWFEDFENGNYYYVEKRISHETKKIEGLNAPRFYSTSFL